MYIGFIGIIGIYLSYYCFKKNKNLFKILVSWMIFSFSLAFLIITKNFILFYPELPKEIPHYHSEIMFLWYERIWFYSIPSLSIFASIGILKLIKVFKTQILVRKKKIYRQFLRYAAVSIFIFFTFSGLTTAGMSYGSEENKIGDNEVLVIGWASENLPRNSRILIEGNFDLERGLQTMTYCKIFHISKEFNENANETENIEEIEDLEERDIKYLLVSKDYLEKSTSLSSFIRRYLIPNFYNESKYENPEYLVYYAPYFD